MVTYLRELIKFLLKLFFSLYSDEDMNWESLADSFEETEQGMISADNKISSETTEIKSGRVLQGEINRLIQ